jgi:hypothetical protein
MAIGLPLIDSTGPLGARRARTFKPYPPQRVTASRAEVVQVKDTEEIVSTVGQPTSDNERPPLPAADSGFERSAFRGGTCPDCGRVFSPRRLRLCRARVRSDDCRGRAPAPPSFAALDLSRRPSRRPSPRRTASHARLARPLGGCLALALARSRARPAPMELDDAGRPGAVWQGWHRAPHPRHPLG